MSGSEVSGTGPLAMPLPEDVITRLIQDALRQLARAELAFPRANSRFSSDQEYIFKHSLLREVAYSLMPHKTRARYHLAVAIWLSEHPNPDFKIMAAEHFERGGSKLEAAAQYESAAEYALTVGASQDAKMMLKRAADLREGRK
jgi:predicted ATPase